MAASNALVELVGTLQEVSTTLLEMRSTLADQRDAVASNDLPRLLTITGQQEELSARLARLERHRQRTQDVLERELRVSGVRQIADRLTENEPFGARLAVLADSVSNQVVELQRENRRSSDLLRSSIELAQRSRAYLLRLSGSEPTYLPPTVSARDATVETSRPVPAP